MSPKGKDGVTLDTKKRATQYGTACASVAEKHRFPEEVQDAICCSFFKQEQHKLITRLARLHRLIKHMRWFHVGTGVFRSVEETTTWLSGRDVKITPGAATVMKSIRFGDEPKYQLLYRTHAREIGLFGKCRLDEVRRKLDELGFGNCPLEAAVIARGQYLGQPHDEKMVVLIDPVTDETGRAQILRFLNLASYGNVLGVTDSDGEIDPTYWIICYPKEGTDPGSECK